MDPDEAGRAKGGLFPAGMPLTKRLMDLGLVVFALPLWFPLFLILWVVVRCALGSPALFRQDRQGYRMGIFSFWKFRSMTEERTPEGELLPDEVRLTRLGSFLRRTSLDELPQLWLVMKGVMSLVGPRPLPIAYSDRYNEEQRGRFAVYPGITGWAQIHGRNQLDWESRFEWDVRYARERTLGLDFRILIQTFWQVLLRRSVRTSGDTLSKPFDPK